MRVSFHFFVLATFFVSSNARISNLAVKTSNGYVCDFSNWHGKIPEYENTCVRKYFFWGTWWTAPYPWCYHNRGSWDYCQSYTWTVDFPEDRRMIESESGRKQYYYDFDQTGASFESARRICQSVGAGWDVAAFQADPSYTWKSWAFRTEGKVYETSVRNVEDALGPLSQTWDEFWVRNSNNERHCLTVEKGEGSHEACGGLGCEGRKGQLGPSFFQQADCRLNYRSFVCEKDLD